MLGLLERATKLTSSQADQGSSGLVPLRLIGAWDRQRSMGTINVSPVATSDLSPWSFSAKSSALAKICFRPARIVVPFAMKRRPTAGFRQFIEKCDADTFPADVAAANPHAVSSRAAIIPA